MAQRDKLQVVIAGAGVAALETALALRVLAEERVTIRLIAPEPHFWYRPLSVLEPFGGAHVQPLELAVLTETVGADFDLGALAAVDAEAHVARTASGEEYEYDALVIACGAKSRDALAGAFTFRGPGDGAAIAKLLDEFEASDGVNLVFAVPTGTTWPLPMYELALLTAARFGRLGTRAVKIAIVTPEDSPLAVFGAEASEAIARLLEQRGIGVHVGLAPLSVDGGMLRLSPSGDLPADRVVALPRSDGRMIPGVPFDEDGFIPTDAHGRVIGLADVYAAGDGTSFPVKQGGLAAQQADAVAEMIAAGAGAPVTPQPFRPILRGLILTGEAPTFVRARIDGGNGEAADIATEALWWPPGKIVGRYLAPFLADKADLVLSPPSDTHEAMHVEVGL